MKAIFASIIGCFLIISCSSEVDRTYKCEGTYYRFDNVDDKKEGLTSSLLVSSNFVENDAVKYPICEKLKSAVKFSSDCSSDKAIFTGTLDLILMNLYLSDRALQINGTLKCVEANK